MSAQTNYRKAFAWLFIFLLLNSSCVVYKKTPIAFEELGTVTTHKIQLKTTSGNTFKTYWSSVEDDEVEINERVKMWKLRQKDIVNTSYFGPQYQLVDLDRALEYEGNVMIETKKKKYQFFDIKQEGEKIVGYTFRGTNEGNITIPKDEIASIKIQNKGASRTGNVLLVLGGGFLLITGISVAAIASNPDSFGP